MADMAELPTIHHPQIPFVKLPVVHLPKLLKM
jgi:hypothetical protein